MHLTLFTAFLIISLNAFSQARSIHVLVALCDNENQGIVPVPKKIGNGQDPLNNLYWGCAYGVKTYFIKQPDWILVEQYKNPSTIIYERLIFKHKDSSVFLIADAYNGAKIKQTTIDFLHYSAGHIKTMAFIGNDTVKMGGNANLLCYIGHNGLMDFSLGSNPKPTDNKKREVVILACSSRSFFEEPIKSTGAYPLIWTTNLMCPEAYTLKAILDSWINRESTELIRSNAAKTYHQYQKCGIKGANKLFVTGYSHTRQ